mmetsp:Transcript_125221/g.297169  ORF Transcript_125221/g.297169 Transcript_125221/m.297169 type:complete len:204 (-) Transcript_125221:748-1359(-)
MEVPTLCICESAKNCISLHNSAFALQMLCQVLHACKCLGRTRAQLLPANIHALAQHSLRRCRVVATPGQKGRHILGRAQGVQISEAQDLLVPGVSSPQGLCCRWRAGAASHCSCCQHVRQLGQSTQGGEVFLSVGSSIPLQQLAAKPPGGHKLRPGLQDLGELLGALQRAGVLIPEGALTTAHGGPEECFRLIHLAQPTQANS